MKADAIQNNSPAAADLNVKSPSGGICCPLVRSLHTIMLNPNIAYAMNADRCPVIDPFVAIDDIDWVQR